MKTRRAALGFRVKSGWAASVLLAGSVRAPELCDSRIIELSDPHDPTTRQPYHAAMGKLETNAANLKRRKQSGSHGKERGCRSSPAVHRQRLHDSSCRTCGWQPNQSGRDRESAYSCARVGRAFVPDNSRDCFAVARSSLFGFHGTQRLRGRGKDPQPVTGTHKACNRRAGLLGERPVARGPEDGGVSSLGVVAISAAACPG
jgi:hypothetical protein